MEKKKSRVKSKKANRKNSFKKYVYLLLCAIVLVLCAIFIFDKGRVPNKVLGEQWIRINKDNEFEVMEFKGNTFSYTYPKLSKSVDSYDLCKQYNYSKTNKLITLNCDKSYKGEKEITLKKVNNDLLIIKIGKEERMFFNYIEGAIEQKVKENNNWTDDEYYDYLKGDLAAFKVIDIKELKKLYKAKTASIVVFGNNKQEYNYVISLERIAKMKDEYNKLTLYYVDTTKLSEDDFKTINKIDVKFESTTNYSSKKTPTVFILKSKSVVDTFQVECSYTTCDYDKVLEQYGFKLKK